MALQCPNCGMLCQGDGIQPNSICFQCGVGRLKVSVLDLEEERLKGKRTQAW